jgi:hypothetical protein
LALDGTSGRPPSSLQKAAKTLLRISGIRPCSQNHLLPDTYRNQDPSVEAGTAGQEALEAVDGGKAGFGVEPGCEHRKLPEINLRLPAQAQSQNAEMPCE